MIFLPTNISSHFCFPPRIALSATALGSAVLRQTRPRNFAWQDSSCFSAHTRISTDTTLRPVSCVSFRKFPLLSVGVFLSPGRPRDLWKTSLFSLCSLRRNTLPVLNLSVLSRFCVWQKIAIQQRKWFQAIHRGWNFCQSLCTYERVLMGY